MQRVSVEDLSVLKTWLLQELRTCWSEIIFAIECSSPVLMTRKGRADWLAVICRQDNVVEDSMVVDPKHHRHFVIRRGQVLREIADEYGGVMVSFPRSGTQSDKVTLKGAKDCVEAAKKRIQEIIEDLVCLGKAVPSALCCFSSVLLEPALYEQVPQQIWDLKLCCQYVRAADFGSQPGAWLLAPTRPFCVK